MALAPVHEIVIQQYVERDASVAAGSPVAQAHLRKIEAGDALARPCRVGYFLSRGGRNGAQRHDPDNRSFHTRRIG